MSLNSVTLSFLVAFVAIFPPEAAASGSGVVSLSSKYARFLARSPHKIPMRGRAAELQKQIESWQVETRPKLTRINRHLVRALKAHHARLLPLSALPCASGRCKELEVSIGELLYLDWTSYYSVTLVARRPLDAAWEKRLTAELRALVRREHVLANIEALAPGKDSEFTLYDSVAGALVQNYDPSFFAAIQRGLPKKRARRILNYAYLRAVDRNKLGLVRKFLKRGAEKNFRNRARYSNTAVHLAVGASHLKLLRFLVKRGVKVDVPNKFGVTPLLAAIDAKHLEAVRLLLAHGANASHIKQNYWTPLHAAASEGSVPLVRLLLAHKARCIKVAGQKSPLDVAKGKAVRRLLAKQPLVRVKPRT